MVVRARSLAVPEYDPVRPLTSPCALTETRNYGEFQLGRAGRMGGYTWKSKGKKEVKEWTGSKGAEQTLTQGRSQGKQKHTKKSHLMSISFPPERKLKEKENL